MNTKALWTLIAFLVWSAGSTYWYVCKIKGFCPTQQITATTPSAGENSNENNASDVKDMSGVSVSETQAGETGDTGEMFTHWLYFDKGSAQPYIADSLQWQNFIDKLKAEKPENKKLKIIGLYLPGETEAMGLQRAEAMKAWFTPYWNGEEILVEAEAAGDNNMENGKLWLDETHFMWVTDNAFVQEKKDKVLIYFPYASDKAITTPEILAYLDELAAAMQQNPSMKVEITGYTDNTGTPEGNKWLGMQRAQYVADLLKQRGIDESRMIVASGGQENPIADNATLEGRRKNRRVEVKIINP